MSMTRAGMAPTAVRALDAIGADFTAGAFTAIMGPSGSGKSTLLHCLAGLDRLTEGRVLIGDVDLGSLNDKAMTLLRRERIGFVFQAFNLAPALTAQENVVLPLTLGGKKPDRAWVDELVRSLGIGDRLDHRPAELSGGQQRVASARALVTRPDLIFADEPTGNLDSRSATELLTQIRRAVDEYHQTVVMVTHDRAFPHLAADWAALWASVGKSPVVIPAAQSPTGTTLRLHQDWFAGQVYNALFTGDIAPIPLIVHTLATAANKTAAMVELTKAYPATPGSAGANQMLFYAFRCDEPWASAPPATLSGQRSSFAYQSDLETDQWYQYVCPLIPKSAAAVGHDPIEQPRNWAGAQQVFPNSRHITLPGQGHDTNDTWGVCAGQVTQTFIERASAAHLNTGCLIAAGPPAFDLTLP